MPDMYILPVYIGIVIFVLLYCISKFIVIPIVAYPRDLDFDKSLEIVQTIISVELDIYENDIFNTQETLTNAQFENYLSDVVNRIDMAITPFLKESIFRYMNEDEFNTWVIRLVRRYFEDKANVEMYDSYEEDENEDTKK